MALHCLPHREPPAPRGVAMMGLAGAVLAVLGFAAGLTAVAAALLCR